MIRFLASVRARLWLEGIGARVPLAAWLGAAVVLLLSAANLFVAIPVHLAAGAAASTVLLVLIIATLDRPSMLHAAMRIDSVMQTRSLFATAIESIERPEPTVADRHVIESAQQVAEAAAGRLGETWRGPSARRLVPALIPVFVAVSLYGVATPDDVQVASSADAARDGLAAALPVDDKTATIAELRKALRESQTPRASRATRDPDGSSLRPATPADDDAVDNVLARDAHEPVPSNASSAGTSIAGDEAGDARRNPHATADAGNATAPDFRGRDAIDIGRHGDVFAGTDAGEAGYAEALAEPDGYTNVAAVPLPASIAGGSTLTTAELAYARRYLAETDRRE